MAEEIKIKKTEHKIKNIEWSSFCSFVWPFNDSYGCSHEFLKVHYEDGSVQDLEEEDLPGMKVVELCLIHGYPVPGHFTYIVPTIEECLDYCKEEDKPIPDRFQFFIKHKERQLQEAKEVKDKSTSDTDEEASTSDNEGKRKAEDKEEKAIKKQKICVNE